MSFTIRKAEHCPEGLTVKSKVGKGGMIEFDVSLDADKIAHAGELYRGQVGANAYLQIGAREQQLASVTVQGDKEGKQTRYRFRLAPSAVRTSELQLSLSLYEKDGLPTLGGGVSMQIPLAGFEPGKNPAAAGAKQ
jgi:hypothetical protein